MGKKNILVLTGSPRENGNSNMMADAFVKGASFLKILQTSKSLVSILDPKIANPNL